MRTCQERGIEMKKSVFALVLVMMLLMTTPVMACVDYGYEDYCGYQYHCYQDFSQMQPRFCPYCGAETWCCTCGYYGQQSYQDQSCGYGYQQSYQCQAYDYGYQDQSYDYGYQDQSYSCGYDQSYQEQSYDCGYQDQTCSYDQSSYSCGSAVMAQWANIRDDCGNIIGSANAGDSIDIYGVCGWDCSRTLIYDYTTGVYGSVLTDCIYGSYVWDGGYQETSCSQTGYSDCGYQDYQSCGYDAGYTDSGYVDQTSCQNDYQDCGYSYGGCSGSGSNYTIMRYERQYESWTAAVSGGCTRRTIFGGLG